MNIEEPMQKAVGRFDWPAVEARLKGIEPVEVRDWTENFLDVILRDGYLILRHPDAGQKEERDIFLEELRSFFDGHGLNDLVDDRSDAFGKRCEYRGRLPEGACVPPNRIQAHLSVDEFAWAAIRAVEHGSREMEASIKKSLASLDQFVDPVAAKLPVDSSGAPASPDGVLHMFQAAPTATLKMLAYDNKWFAQEGNLVPPPPVPTSSEHENLANGCIYLATAWSQIERSDGRCRYFGGTVTRENMEFQSDEKSEEGPHRWRSDHILV